MATGTAPGPEEVPGIGQKDATKIRTSLKRAIGKAKFEKVTEIFKKISTEDDLRHIISQSRYSQSLMEFTNHHFFNALNERTRFEDSLKGRPMLAASQKSVEKLKQLSDRLEKLGKIQQMLTNAGMGIYPE